MKLRIRTLSFTLLLTILIWGIGFFIAPYKIEESILFASGFPGHEISWHAKQPAYAKVDSTSVTLQSASDEKNTLTYNCPKVGDTVQARKVRVAARVAIVEPGVSDNITSVLGFWFLDKEGDIASYHNIHIVPGRYKDSTSYKVFDWPSNAVSCVFGLIANVGGPTITVSEASVNSVSANKTYQIALAVLLLTALAYVCFLLWLAWGRLSLWHLLMPCVLTIALLVGITLTGPLIVKYVHPIMYWAAAQLNVGNLETSANGTALAWLFKVGHALLFFFIALYFFIIRQRLNSNYLGVAVILLVLAVASEGVQLHLQDRGASGLDILFDWSGILLAWIVCWLFFAVRGGVSDGTAAKIKSTENETE